MEKMNYINKIVNCFIDKKIIDAAYLEAASNIKEEAHLHIVLEENKKDKFNRCYTDILESLSNVVFIKKSKDNTYLRFDNDQAVIIYLEFDNYYVKSEYFVLYDPNGNLTNEILSPTPDDIGNVLNDITYNLDKFLNHYRVEDKVNAIHYLTLANENVLKYFNYVFNPNKMYRNYKTLISDLPRDLRPKYNKMLSKLKIDSLIECAKMIFVLIDDFVSNISINVAFIVDIDYYLFIKKAIFTF